MKTSKLRLRPFMPIAEQVGSEHVPIHKTTERRVCDSSQP